MISSSFVGILALVDPWYVICTYEKNYYYNNYYSATRPGGEWRIAMNVY